jgi:hypothetical protein
MKVRAARHIILFWMNKTRFVGVALPWAVYIHPEHLNNERLLRHERAHVEQFRREGWMFYVRYVWYNLRFGYRNNPYEIEARAAERQAPPRGI